VFSSSLPPPPLPKEREMRVWVDEISQRCGPVVRFSDGGFRVAVEDPGLVHVTKTMHKTIGVRQCALMHGHSFIYS
jgi:hypothetical protein